MFSSEKDDGVVYNDIEEIFLVKTSRRKGLAERICVDFWQGCTGIGTLHVLPNNVSAICFWDKLLSKCGYAFTRCDEGSMTVYRFKLGS